MGEGELGGAESEPEGRRVFSRPQDVGGLIPGLGLSGPAPGLSALEAEGPGLPAGEIPAGG
eukprot:15134308-Alexandrium_andersonii.AAC.1